MADARVLVPVVVDSNLLPPQRREFPHTPPPHFWVNAPSNHSIVNVSIHTYTPPTALTKSRLHYYRARLSLITLVELVESRVQSFLPIPSGH